MRRLPLIVTALAMTAGLALVLAATLRRQRQDADLPHPHFSLLDTAGRQISEADLRGSVALIYFGYTFCPDICPTELGWMRRVALALGEDAARVRQVFISVDPERDTPAKLADYAALFDARLLALTGTPEALRSAGDAFGAIWRRAEVVGGQPGYYLIDHTMSTFVLDRDGALVGRLQSRDLPPADAAAFIRRHL